MYYYYLHFTEEKIRAQESKLTCLKTHKARRWWSRNFDPDSLAQRLHF